MKIPELILNEPFDMETGTVFRAIDGYPFRGDPQPGETGFSVCRVGGCRFAADPDGGETVIGWQCNFADIKNYDIQLPTVIRIDLDPDGIIEDIELDPCFRGSQGIPCSRTYLNRRLQAFAGQPFEPHDKALSDPLGTACRHTFEVVYGACCFRDRCLKEGLDEGQLSEATAARLGEDRIEAVDRISINGREVVTEIDIEHFKESLEYDVWGAISGCRDVAISSWLMDGGEKIPAGDPRTMSADSNRDFSLKIMKILSRPWMKCGRACGARGGFYYSHLWPPTLMGILVQAFAISIFGDSYSYFQHCIKGLQKGEDHTNCIGVCEDLADCEACFPDFQPEDLY